MNTDFSKNLRYLRQERNLTQLQLSELLHYTQSNISEWEKGSVEPKASALKTLSDFFDVSIEYLLGIEDDFGKRTIEKATPQLNAEEQQLLNDYRALSAPGKQLIKTTLKTLLPSSEAAQRKNKKLQ